MRKIAIVGLDPDDSIIIQRLQDAGQAIHVVIGRQGTNVTADGAFDRPVGRKATWIEPIESCDALITRFRNPVELQQVADGLLPWLQAGQLWIDVSTLQPGAVQSLAGRLQKHGVVFADAPFAQGTAQGSDPRLVSFVGCRREHFNRVKMVIAIYSDLVQRFGEAGSGKSVKLVNEYLTHVTALATVEAFQRIRRTGIDERAFFDTVVAGPARSDVFQRLGAALLDGIVGNADRTVCEATFDIGNYLAVGSEIDAPPSLLADAVHRTLRDHLTDGKTNARITSLLRE